MIKPRDADEKGREWWRHAEEGGGSGKQFLSKPRDRGAYHWLNPFNFSFPPRIVRGIDNTIPLFVCARENIVVCNDAILARGDILRRDL